MDGTTEYIRSKHLDHRIRNGQINLRECPFCEDTRWHFYINQKNGLFFCHKCQEKGNLNKLKGYFGDQEVNRRNDSYKDFSKVRIVQAFPQGDTDHKHPSDDIITRGHEALLADADALDYVTSKRGISMDTVKRFKLGLETDKEGVKWLMIPHYVGKKAVNVKYRTLPPAEKQFRRYPGGKTVLFNQDILETKPDAIYLVEGEIDCLSLIDKMGENVVGVSAGAGSFTPEWIDLLEPVKRINIVYDPDKSGQRGAQDVAYRLGYERCFNVVLPDGLDVNEYFQNHDVFDFQPLVQKAKRFDVSGILSLEDGFELLKKDQENENEAVVMTGFPSVDRLLKSGLKPGDLCVVSAPPKIGKTSWVLQVAIHNATQGIPTLFFSMEMRPEKIIEKIVRFHTQKDDIGDNEIGETRKDLEGVPLYVGYLYKKPTMEEVLRLIKNATRRYGLKLVAFDHLHFLCRSLTNQTQEISIAVQSFKLLAEEIKIPIILIAQPRKVEGDRVMNAQDLKDSSSIYSDCDHLIILHRQRLTSRISGGKKPGKTPSTIESLDNSFDPVTLVRVEASRYNSGGEALLYFKGELSRFYETEFHQVTQERNLAVASRK